MRVIVSGGTGLIGSRLIPLLLEKGHEVAVLTRSDRATEDGSLLHYRQWDGCTEGPWIDAIDGADAVVHLAGEGIAEGRWTADKKQRILESRTQSTEVLARAVEAAKARPSVFLQGSAVGWYGSTQAEVDESAPPGSDFLADVCRAWENSSVVLDPLGVRRPILRTGVVLSTAGGALPKMLLPFRMFAGGPLGNGRQWFPWIHLDDEVRAIVHLLEHETAHGPFNLTAPQSETNGSFTKILGKVLQRPSFMPAPGFALKAVLGEMSVLLLEGQKAVPKALEESGFKFSFPDAEGALRDLLSA